MSIMDIISSTEVDGSLVRTTSRSGDACALFFQHGRVTQLCHLLE